MDEPHGDGVERKQATAGVPDTVTVAEAQRVVLPGSRIAGGHDGLQRRVTWATSLRSRPPAFETRGGGEFVLASQVALDGLRQVDPSMTIERILEGLAQAGAAAFALPSPLSKRARALADDLSLPLVEMAPETPVLDAERGIIGLVLDRHNEMQARASEFYRRLAQLSMEGRGLEAIVHEAAQSTRRMVAFEDAQFRLRTIAAPTDSEGAPRDDVILSAVEERGRLSEIVRSYPLSSTTPVAIRLPAARLHLSRFASPVMIRDRPRGFVSICGPDASLSDFDQLAASRVAAICGLELAKEEAVLAAEQRAQRDLMDELLSPSQHQDTTRRRAAQAGFDPAGLFGVFAFAVTDVETRPMLIAAAEAINRRARQEQQPVITRVEGDELLVICQIGTDPVSGTIDPDRASSLPARQSTSVSGASGNLSNGTTVAESRLRVAGNELFALATGGADASHLCAGGSRPVAHLSALPQAAIEARDALRIGRHVHGGGRLLLYSDLGLYRLLYVLRDSAELRAFYDQTLGPLEEYDRRAGQNLVETLEVFFACNGNLSQTAQRLHHHRNSLLYRIGRIQEISGFNLEDPEARLALQFALKARQLFT
jgi:PucR family transcriptional regulator, purine catabolism regulatory protein